MAGSTGPPWPVSLGTLVFYMGVTRLESICKTLMRVGKPETTPAALVEAGTLPRQRTVSGTLADFAPSRGGGRTRSPALTGRRRGGVASSRFTLVRESPLGGPTHRRDQTGR